MSTVLDIALSQVGVEEEPHGSNWGVKVKEYLACVGIQTPAPWCMAFVVWCLNRAGDRTHPNTASCSFMLNWCKERGKVVKSPQPGDIFLLVRPNGAAFHTGFVTIPGALFFYTVEGNSNSSGSPEGFQVVRRKRLRRNVVFVRMQ